MNTALKLGIAAGAIGAILLGVKAVKKTINDFTYEVVGYGDPSVKGARVTVPVKIKFNNPAIIPINVDHIVVDVYLLKQNGYVKAVTVDQAISLPKGNSVQVVYPVLDLQAVFGGNVMDTLNTVLGVAQSKKIVLKTDITATYKGVTIPTQTVPPQEISF